MFLSKQIVKHQHFSVWRRAPEAWLGQLATGRNWNKWSCCFSHTPQFTDWTCTAPVARYKKNHTHKFGNVFITCKVLIHNEQDLWKDLCFCHHRVTLCSSPLCMTWKSGETTSTNSPEEVSSQLTFNTWLQSLMLECIQKNLESLEPVWSSSVTCWHVFHFSATNFNVAI